MKNSPAHKPSLMSIDRLITPAANANATARELLVPVVFFLCLFLLTERLAAAGLIEGVVFSEQGPASGATVSAYTSYEDLVANRVFQKSEPGVKEGQFTLQLDPGRYYLVAHAGQKDHPLFSYHGINPISVTNDYLWLPFLLVEETQATCQSAPEQGISGKVTYKGQPLNGGVVSVYPWQEGKFRGMGLLTNTLNENGLFSFGLEPGSYVVIARKKQDIRGIGPVQRGDMFCYPSANPLKVTSGQLCSVDINCYPRDDLDLFLNADTVNPQGRRHESRRHSSLSDLQPAEIPVPAAAIRTVISGIITDSTGKPRPGLTITAYPSNGLEIFQMHVVRLISENMGHSDQDGRYRIELPDGGKFYIVAREKVGEAPDRGEYYGLYEGSANHSVVIKKGDNLTGINVVVDRIMPNLDSAYDLNQK